MRRLVPLLVGFAFASFALADDAIEKPILVLDAGGHTAKVCKVLFTPDGRELITVSDDKTIRLWDVPSGEPRRVLRPPIGPGPEGMLFAAALAERPDPGGRRLPAGIGQGRCSDLSHLAVQWPDRTGVQRSYQCYSCPCFRSRRSAASLGQRR